MTSFFDLLNQADSSQKTDVYACIMDSFNCSRAHILAALRDPITETESLTLFHTRWSDYLNHKPMAYILGHTQFLSHIYHCEQGVLIPRPETELLVEKTIETIKEHNIDTLIECGTGSGIISIECALATGVNTISWDINSKAITLAKKNAKNLGADKVRFLEEDFFGADLSQYITPKTLFVSNPPYIPTRDLETLDKGVRDFEPVSALDGGDDGLVFHQKLMDIAATYKSTLFLEIGIHQSTLIEDVIAFDLDVESFKSYTDSQGIDRVLGVFF